MDTSELKQWFIYNNIENRTIEGFWGYFHNYRDEDIYDFEDAFGDAFGDIDERLIKVKVNKVQLTHIFKHGDFIYSILNVYFMEDYFGEYKSVFTLDGEDEDDILRLQPSSMIKKLTAEANRSIEIAKESLCENLNSELIAKITGLELDFINELRNEL